MGAGLAVLAVSAYGVARRTRPAPAAPAPPPPEPPQAPAPQRRRFARRRIVAGLSVAALSFAGAAFSAEPIVPERWIPRPAIGVPGARPLPLRALVRHRQRFRHRLRQHPRRRTYHPLSLTERVLRDPHIHIYPGGRADIASGRVDRRILRVLLYLARLDHEVTVSSLISGHRYWARSGVVSAHIYGRAVDIAALDGVPIAGHQYDGSLIEQTVRALLRLQPGLRPMQIISGFELGGPSFDLPGHADHIHVGY